MLHDALCKLIRELTDFQRSAEEPAMSESRAGKDQQGTEYQPCPKQAAGSGPCKELPDYVRAVPGTRCNSVLPAAL